jgi:hypothetical protein
MLPLHINAYSGNPGVIQFGRIVGYAETGPNAFQEVWQFMNEKSGSACERGPEPT